MIRKPVYTVTFLGVLVSALVVSNSSRCFHVGWQRNASNCQLASTKISSFLIVNLTTFGCLTMPRNCVIGGCTRTSSKNREVSFFKFPLDEQQRREWVRFVCTTRADFKFADVTEWSRVCSKHFDDDCRDQSSRMKQHLGLKTKFLLKESAVPSLKSPTNPTSVTTQPSKRPRGAFAKREKERVGPFEIFEYIDSS